MVKTNCKNCNKTFMTWPYRLSDGSITCSRTCGSKSHQSNSKGKKWNKESRDRLAVSKTKENPKYSALHYWVRKVKGSPKECEACGIKDKNRRYEWSNISGVYNRVAENYERLCIPCHRKKDGHDKFYKYSSSWRKHVIVE